MSTAQLSQNGGEVAIFRHMDHSLWVHQEDKMSRSSEVIAGKAGETAHIMDLLQTTLFAYQYRQHFELLLSLCPSLLAVENKTDIGPCSQRTTWYSIRIDDFAQAIKDTLSLTMPVATMADNDADPPINKLPPELLAIVMDLTLFQRYPTSQHRTSMVQILDLRLVNRDFAAAGASVLQRIYRNLFIHSTSESIRAFEQICKDPLYSRGIRTVYYLGARFHQDWNTIQKFASNPEILAVINRYRLPDEAIEEEYEEHMSRMKEQDDILTTQADVHAMIANFPLLPNLERVIFCTELEDCSWYHIAEGLNFPEYWYDSESSWKSLEDRWRRSKILSIVGAMKRDMVVADLFPRERGVMIQAMPPLHVMAALKDSKAITKLDMRLPWELMAGPDMANVFIYRPMQDATRALTSLTLHLTHGCSGSNQVMTGSTRKWAALLSSARRLKHLKLSFHYGIRGGLLLDSLCSAASWPELKSVEIISDDVFKWGVPPNHHFSLPSGSAIEKLLMFLLKHEPTLRGISLQRSARDTNEYSNEIRYPPASSFRTFIDTLRSKLPNLEIAQIEKWTFGTTERLTTTVCQSSMASVTIAQLHSISDSRSPWASGQTWVDIVQRDLISVTCSSERHRRFCIGHA